MIVKAKWKNEENSIQNTKNHINDSDGHRTDPRNASCRSKAFRA